MVRKMPSEPRHARRLLFRCAGESEPRHARRLVFRCAGEYRGSVANRHSVVLCEPLAGNLYGQATVSMPATTCDTNTQTPTMAATFRSMAGDRA